MGYDYQKWFENATRKVLRCDRCGSYFPRTRWPKHKLDAFRTYRKDAGDRAIFIEEYNLCRKCSASLEKWIKNESTDS